MLENVKMYKLFKNKKAFNDVTIVATILFIFLGTAVIMPFVNTAFDIEGAEYDTDKVASDLIGEELEDVSKVGVGDILKSVGKIFFWTFGDLPFWLDLIFVILRIILLYILVRTFTPFIAGGG